MEVVTIGPRELAAKRQNGEPVELIDVRTPVEYREVHCPFARNVPLSDLDPKAVMTARNGTADETALRHLPVGQSGPAGVREVPGGGLHERRQRRGRHPRPGPSAGLPVNRGKKAISLERQVRIAAGLLVRAGGGAGLLRPPVLHRPVGVRRGRAGVRRRHRHLRHGPDARPDAVEPGFHRHRRNQQPAVRVTKSAIAGRREPETVTPI